MNNSNSFEKPKDWNVAPESSWVSGTPIGQSAIKMPKLGDPGSHENASQRVSFGDDDGADIPSMYRGKQVSQCPPGTSSQGGICTPDPKSKASLESRQKTMRGGAGPREDEEEEEKFVPGKSAKREPALPAATEADPQIKRIAKEGYKGR